MRYCLSGKQSKEYLMKADEIKVQFKDLNNLLTIYEINPIATIILDLPAEIGEIEIDWEKIKRYNTMLQGRLIISTFAPRVMETCKSFGIKFYYPVPITTFFDLQALKTYGSCYALIDTPLTNMLDKVKQVGIPLRMVPNVAYYALIPRQDGVLGSWIRPEDVELYEQYIDVFEFEDCDIKKEQALYRIYNEQKKWPGDLNILISNFGKSCTGSLIAGETLKKRLNCGQTCQSGGACHICYRLSALANPETYQKINNINK